MSDNNTNDTTVSPARFSALLDRHDLDLPLSTTPRGQVDMDQITKQIKDFCIIALPHLPQLFSFLLNVPSNHNITNALHGLNCIAVYSPESQPFFDCGVVESLLSLLYLHDDLNLTQFVVATLGAIAGKDPQSLQRLLGLGLLERSLELTSDSRILSHCYLPM